MCPRQVRRRRQMSSKNKETLKKIADAIRPLRKQSQRACCLIGIFARHAHLGTNQIESEQKVQDALNDIESILLEAGYLERFEHDEF